jgi:GH24 family phage-related lysozyme (muramidase)
MGEFREAVELIRKYEGFSEKAYPSGDDGKYTVGYGTQFYPDGSPVKLGQWCTKEKALEYLYQEVKAIRSSLDDLNLSLDHSMEQALISFIHSVGWTPFLYSNIIDAIERDDLGEAAEEIKSWIFDEDHEVIGGLLDRRREEVALFLREVDGNPWVSTEVLMTAFRNYSAAPHQVRAIRNLEENINPYVLAEFANEFRIADSPWIELSSEELDTLFAT